jgi:hypothetical protein
MTFVLRTQSGSSRLCPNPTKSPLCSSTLESLLDQAGSSESTLSLPPLPLILLSPPSFPSSPSSGPKLPCTLACTAGEFRRPGGFDQNTNPRLALSMYLRENVPVFQCFAEMPIPANCALGQKGDVCLTTHNSFLGGRLPIMEFIKYLFWLQCYRGNPGSCTC